MGRKVLGVFGVAAAMAAAGASPAMAGDVPSMPQTAVASPPLSVTGTYTGQLSGTNQLLVEYVCEANAPGAVSVALTRCGVYGNHPLALPGPVVANGGVETLPLAPFRLCFAATATYLNATTKSASGCTANLGAASSLAGTGVAVSSN